MLKKLIRSIIGLIVAVVAVVAIVFVFFLKPIVASQIKSRTGFDVKIQSMSVNPLTGTAKIDGLVITNPPNAFKTPGFVDLTAMHADVSLRTVFFGDQLVVNSARFDAPAFTLVSRASAPSNAELFMKGLDDGAPAQQPAPKPSDKPFKFLIKKLDLNLGKIVFVNEPASGEPKSRSIDVNLKETYENITDPKQFLTQSPALAKSILGIGSQLSDLIPGKFGESVNKSLNDGIKFLDKPKEAVTEAVTGAAKSLLDKVAPKK